MELLFRIITHTQFNHYTPRWLYLIQTPPDQSPQQMLSEAYTLFAVYYCIMQVQNME